MQAPILLLVSDQAVLSSLQFSLGIEGFAVADAAAEGIDPSVATFLIIDRGHPDDGLNALAALRSGGCAAPAVVLVTNPTPRMRQRVAAAGAVLVEKPLLGDDLTQAIRFTKHSQEAA